MSSVVVHGETVPDSLNADFPLVRYDDAYAKSKYESEMRFWELVDQYHLHGSIVRPTYVWGPYSMWYTIYPLELMRKGDFVWADHGNGICNAVYVGNVVDICLKCCTTPAADHQAFIVTDGIGTAAEDESRELICFGEAVSVWDFFWFFNFNKFLSWTI